MAIEAKQTEAKRLAQILESSQDFYPESSMRFNTNLADSCDQAAAELRRIDTLNVDVGSATLRLLAALDAMDRGCREPGFRGYENGHGEEVGTELQEAREHLAALVGHVPAIEEPAGQ